MPIPLHISVASFNANDMQHMFAFRDIRFILRKKIIFFALILIVKHFTTDQQRFPIGTLPGKRKFSTTSSENTSFLVPSWVFSIFCNTKFAQYTCWEDGGTDACALKNVEHNLAEVGHLYNL